MSKRIKSLITQELETKFKGSDAAVVVDYIGISATKANQIRADLMKKKIKMTVVRNALAAKALGTVGLKGADTFLTGTSAVVYGGDSIVDVVKELLEQAKKVEQLKIKGAIFEGQVFDTKATQALAKLPNKKELQSIIVGQIKSPASKIAGQLKGPAGKLAGQVKTLIEKKEKEGAEPAAA